MPYIGVSPQFGVRRKHTYTATASQTSFSGAGAEGATLSYTDSNFVDVYQNGVKLGDADYTSTSGTAIVLGTGATVNDIIEIIVFDAFSAADTVSKADGGTFDGNVTMAGTLGVTGASTLTGGVSGDTTFTGSITGTTATFSTADNNAQLTLVSTDADASSGPNILLKRDSASPADNDTVGRIKFVFDNDAGQETEAVRIDAFIPDVSDGTEDATFQELTMVGGTMRSRVEHSSSETVFNQDSQDIDFRVESNGNTHAIFVQSGADNVGIKTSSPNDYYSSDFVVTASDEGGITIVTATDHRGYLTFADGTSGDARYRGYISYDHNTDQLILGSGGSGALLINSSGKLAVNNTDFDAMLDINHDYPNTAIRTTSDSTNGHWHLEFHNPNGRVGNIITAGSGTTFTTSSDYRLKENVKYDFDATSRLKQLKPCRFNFKTDKDLTVDGFLAHEVSSIVPEAINGEKDAMTKEILYVEGDEIPEGKKVGDVRVPVQIDPQSIDHSKLVPLLVKTIQELEARITALESK